jgi:lipopolysaccharide export system permease protein
VLPFFLGFGLVTFLFVMDFLFDYLDLLLSKGVPPLVVLELFVLALGWITALSFPCGVLVAALMTFGRLAQDNEVAAMRALGINVGRVLRAPLGAALVLAILLTLFNNYVLPETNHRFANLTLAIHKKSPAARIEPGMFIDAFDNYTLLVKKVDPRSGHLEGITILDYTQGKSPTTILARSGDMEYIDSGATLRLELREGEVHEVPGEAAEGKYRKLEFEEQTLFLTNPGAVLRRQDRKTRGEREMNVGMMWEQIRHVREQRAARVERLDEKVRVAGYASYAEFEKRHASSRSVGLWRAVAGLLGGRGRPAPVDSAGVDRQLVESVQIDRAEVESLDRRIDSFKVEIHKKFSIPFACAVFVLLGGPLGIRMRRGGFANMAVAVAFFIIYYLLLIGGETLADRRFISPWLSMWFPNILLGAIGIYLTASVTGMGTSRGMR